jgi:hypothetical protein
VFCPGSLLVLACAWRELGLVYTVLRKAWSGRHRSSALKFLSIIGLCIRCQFRGSDVLLVRLWRNWDFGVWFGLELMCAAMSRGVYGHGIWMTWAEFRMLSNGIGRHAQF